MKSAYNKGYSDGINDRDPLNPYNFGTLDYAQYENGYDEGVNDNENMQRDREFF